VVPRLASVVTAGDFALETFHGAVADFHATDLLADVRPRIVVCAAEAAALVLGSRQPFDTVDVDACRRAGIDVVQRRSGGGVVLVEPGAMCWLDVVVPATDPRFESVAHDVGASMRWLGEHVAAALRSFGVAAVKVHDGPMTGGRWSPLVCFAGVGPGEVLLGRRKLVGISQRRTRRGARFQCMVHVRWSPDVLVGLLAVPRPTVDELPPVAVVSREIADALPRAVARSLTDAKG
jgi:lipoate-protein ligase A